MNSPFIFRFRFFAIIFLCSLFIQSCQEYDGAFNYDVDAGLQQEIATMSGISYQFADVLASSLVNEEIKHFIYEEASKKFDGDNNFLFLEAKDKAVNSHLKSTSITFGELIESGQNELLKSVNNDLSGLYDSIAMHCPLLQIYVWGMDKIDLSEIDFLSEDILVAVLPAFYDETSSKKIDAFDSNGKKHKLDPHKDPDQFVIVVSFNERVITVSKKDKNNPYSDMEPYFETKDYFYYLNANLLDLKSSLVSDRDNNGSKDRLNKAKFLSVSGMKELETWSLGQPEMTVKIVYAKKVSEDASFNTMTKGGFNDGWFHTNKFWGTRYLDERSLNDTEIVTWDIETYGDKMLYQWMELDGGWKVSFKVTLSTKVKGLGTVSEEINIGKDNLDKSAGQSIVEYNDGTSGDGTRYSTGYLEFWVYQN